ncbi:receptor-like protein EIX1 [Cannabis sativa]|uniref:receptor-like protein EIX1 n=1 Tax=Cannabis sativa TaxID=3483 RepID=UPI0029CA72D9|nr:receptor-like protein EIX1 [Cannabis sativa]
MNRLAPQIVILVMFWTYLRGIHGVNYIAGSVGEAKIMRCIDHERQALLKFKQQLYQIKDGFLSSWEKENTDCCDWYGVQCSNESGGHVTALDLSPSTNRLPPRLFYEEEDRFLRGNISSWILELKFLTYLDLSSVDFQGNQIPFFIGALTQFRYLNLSHTQMNGEIPPQLANLSSLQVLDLGNNYELTLTNMKWVSHLSSLRVLDLTETNMSKAIDWVQTVSQLPYLTNLVLSLCQLPNITIPSSLSLLNSSKSLAILDLSYNRLSAGSVYQMILNFSRSLVHLNLWENQINGFIPEAFQNMSALEYLELGANELEGFIPEALGKMSTLAHLGLSLNEFKGSILEALGNLTDLTYLDVGSNQLEGEFPKSLWNLCKLRTLRARENNLRRVMIPEQNQLLSRCPQYHSLEYLDFGWNRIIGPLPNLTLFSSLKVITLYLNQFSGTVPESFGRLTQLEELDLSSNSLKGVISEAHLSKLSKLSHLSFSQNSLIWNITYYWLPPFKLDFIGLEFCKLGPRFPKWLQTQKDYSILSISNAGISDSIPNWFWDIFSSCYSMDLSDNQLHGKITDSSFEFMYYPEVNLSSNELEGSIPHFMFKVGALDLSMNRFSKLDSICHITNDTNLTLLDISINQLSGNLPDCWSYFK